MPPWLAKAYARIYARKKTGEFGFSEAAEILEIEDERPLAKTLSKLKSSGHLTVKRDPLDPRRKLFRLVDPESMTIAFAIQSKARTAEALDKVKAASGFLDYYVNGPYAAHRYHGYAAPGSVEISVRPHQLFTWIALLSEGDVALSTDDIPAEKRTRVNVRLRSDFEEKLAENTRFIDGTRYLSPEALVATGLTGRLGFEDALAILIVQRKKLDWKKLLALAEAYSSTRLLGCTMDILNFESGKVLFEPSLITNILRKSNLEARVDFPSSLVGEPLEDKYAKISSRWNIRIHVSSAAVSKIITDLLRT